MSEDIRDALFDEIYQIASNDNNVIFIAADADAFSLQKYKKDFPDRFINVGVAEQNMVTVATGLALSGKKVFIYAILSFITMRCYEQIKFNICGMNLPVTLIGLGTGMSFNFDGSSHHAVSDVGLMRMLPEISIFNPSTAELASASVQLAYKGGTPSIIRLDKGIFKEYYSTKTDLSNGFTKIKNGTEVCIISSGSFVHEATKAADLLSKKYSTKIAVIDLFRLKPVNNKLLSNEIGKYKKIITLEEHSIIGGVGSILSNLITNKKISVDLTQLALQDIHNHEYGTREWLLGQHELDSDGIIKRIEEVVSTLHCK